MKAHPPPRPLCSRPPHPLPASPPHPPNSIRSLRSCSILLSLSTTGKTPLPPLNPRGSWQIVQGASEIITRDVKLSPSPSSHRSSQGGSPERRPWDLSIVCWQLGRRWRIQVDSLGGGILLLFKATTHLIPLPCSFLPQLGSCSSSCSIESDRILIFIPWECYYFHPRAS